MKNISRETAKKIGFHAPMVAMDDNEPHSVAVFLPPERATKKSYSLEAQHLREAAASMRAQAMRLEMKARAADGQQLWKNRMKRKWEAARAARRFVEGGWYYRDALSLCAASYGVREATIEIWLQDEYRACRAARRFWRDREIMRLAGLGWTNAQIGAHVGLTPQWVSRIIQRQLRIANWHRIRPIFVEIAGFDPAGFR